jgi:DHA2 family multidrug resistance protein
LRDTFPPKQLGLSQAIYTVGAVVGPSAGPTLGGILTDNVSWRWVFDVNIIPGIIAIVLLLPLLRNPARTKSNGFDIIGIALLTVGLGSLQYVLDEGERSDWFNDGTIVVLTCSAVAGLIAFVIWELQGTNRPIVDLRVLFRRSVGFGCLIAMVNASVVFGQLLVLPQYMTNVLGFTATQDGILLAVRALPILLLTIPLGQLANSRRVDPRVLLACGLACAGAGVIRLGFVTTSTTNFDSLVLPILLTGVGISFVFTPLLVAVMGNVKPVDSPKAGAFISLALNLGGSVASASLVALIDRRESFHGSVVTAHATLANPAVTQFVAQFGLARLGALCARQSAALAYADTFFVLGTFAIVLAPLAFALPRRKAAT